MATKYKKNEHGLPVPRLQVRMKLKHNQVKVTYSLIRHQVHGMEEVVIHRSNYTPAYEDYNKDLEYLKPHSTLAHVLADMWELRLPAYMVANTGYVEIKLIDQVNQITWGQWNLMAKNTDRAAELKLLKDKLADNQSQLQKTLDSISGVSGGMAIKYHAEHRIKVTRNPNSPVQEGTIHVRDAVFELVPAPKEEE